jgi:8-oxo-dGTP diphosphatase
VANELTPTLASAVVILDERGRVLLVKENYDRRRWRLPGGVVEPGETPAEAAIREAAEETSLTVELDRLIALYYLRTRRRGLRFIFAGRIVGGKPRVRAGAEIAEVAWFPTDDLPDHTTPSAPFAIGDAVAGANGLFRDIDASADLA